MKKLIMLFACLSVCVLCLGAVTSGRLHFRTAGFSIQPLEVSSPTRTYQALQMFMPPSDGFTPNVNVQVQPYTGTMDEYVALSRKQFAEMKFTVVKESRPAKNIAAFECTGKMAGHSLHAYSRAIATEKYVYLATAVATDAQWKTHGAKLKACVDTLAAEAN